MSVKLKANLRLAFPFRSAVLQPDMVMVVEEWLEMANEIIQSDTCSINVPSFYSRYSFSRFVIKE